MKPTRLNPESDNFIQDPPEVEDFSNSILICDDIEAYTNKHTVLRKYQKTSRLLQKIPNIVSQKY